MKKILILASNPRKDLELGYEIHLLKNMIEDCREREEFEVIIDDAISPENLQQLFLKHQPRIVHFCGHGSGANGLVFVGDADKEQLVGTQALSNLFKEFSNIVECVLLNACYSEVQATAIVQHINYAIGMNQAIRDEAAIIFAKGFYQALGHGKAIQQCYGLAKNEIELELSNLSEQKRKFEAIDGREHIPIPEHLKPTIKVKSKLTLFPEDIARQKYLRENQADFYLGQREQPSSSKQEYRYRQVLLNKVRDSWIKGVLENSLHTKALVELKIQGKPDLVTNPFSQYQELPVDPNSSYEWLQASDIFEQMGDGRTLLILGEPGAGKTIALLKLAKRFIEKANKNLSLPIPIVFTLSSWAIKQQPIDEWLIVELKEKYQLPKSIAKAWIGQEQLLLLLDGLDEVKTEDRNACVIALNKFLNSHSLTEIVVCSRFQEYKALAEKLELRSAIYIQPLTTEHINYYLRDAGKQLSGLKTLLQRDKEIEEFAKTPLILSIMSLTYHKFSSEEVLKQLSSPENRYQNLFNSYTERMLSRKVIAQKYSKDKVLSWLSWLAKTMVDESQTVFLIENIQPKWLQTKIQTATYLICSLITSALIIGLSSIQIYSILLKIGKSWSVWFYLAVFALLIGFIYVFIQETIGLIFTYTRREIKTFEIMGWSWKKAINGSASGSIFTLFISTLYFVVMTGNGGDILSSLDWVVMLVLTTGILGGIWGGIIGIDSEAKTIPNEGILSSAKNAGVIGIISGLFFGIIGNWTFGLIKGSIIGFIFGLNFANANGGKVCIQHFFLRRILYRKGRIPWNYAKFLDYASERLLMKKVGGGYIFYHRMLMEHFAQRYQE